ncbi:NADPH-dependent F420 reductase [Lacticaseibacillus rhamnosus]|uniref:NADPH-dependent F420 reductase n=1 Tax=Lacticaseibacillus rhamnosus TaxID=47715 RepID=UPI000532BB93|nr:NAD(P)-binding domain-containing protein [Lacticaseibacillus rhamnosus]
MSIGIIGSGNVGRALGQLFSHVGEQVILSHRHGVASLAPVIAEMRSTVEAGTVAEAANQDIVVLAVPFNALDELPAQVKADAVVIDATNYFPSRDGERADLTSHQIASSQLVAQHFGTKKVVKAFNTIAMTKIRSLAKPNQTAGQIAIPIAGDDTAAKQTVTALIEKIGFDVVDLGDLANSYPAQADGPLFLFTGDADQVRAQVNK